MFWINRKKNRSDIYQPMYTELPHSNEMMAEFSNTQGLVENYSPEDKERLLDLREQLAVEARRLIKEHLTDRQREVVELCVEGYTQIEIAKKLNVNQSSVTKSLNGNCDYRNGRRVYGGSKRKMRKLSENDDKIKEILAEIAEIHSFYASS